LNFELVERSNILVGPGSYYSDPLITLFFDDRVTNEIEAHQFVIQYESDNPIVMWQIRDGIFAAHRLSFMSQNLDSSSGKSPEGFVNDIKTYLIGRGFGYLENDVHVRTDVWWSLYGS
jgi:hypothetical protein